MPDLQTSKLNRFFLRFILVLVGVLMFAVVIFRFSPQTILAVNNVVSSMDISARRVDTTLFPLSIDFKHVTATENHKRIAGLQKLKLSADLLRLVRGEPTSFDVELAEGLIDLRSVASTNAQSESEPEQEQEQEPSKLDLHRLLSSLSARANNLKLIIDDNSQLLVKSVNSASESQDEATANTRIHVVALSIVYSLADAPLVIDATMRSSKINGATNLTIDSNKVDLRALTKVNESTEGETAAEATLDWQWLKSIQSTTIELNIAELLTSDLSLKDSTVQIGLDESLSLALNGSLNYLFSAESQFYDEVTIQANLSPIAEQTMGQDLEGFLRLKSPGLNASIEGVVNVNGLHDNILEFNLAADKYPLLTKQASDTSMDGFFPLTAKGRLTSDATQVSLSGLSMKLGASDIQGAIDLNNIGQTPLTIMGEINSNTLVLKSEEATAPLNTEPTREEVKIAEPLFSKEPLGWAWLNELELDLHFSADKFRYAPIELQALSLPIKLRDATLSAEQIKASFADGEWLTSLALEQRGAGASIVFDSELKDASLEAMNLIPSEQISRGNTNLSTALTTQGVSLHELASSLQGNLLLQVTDGVIANDYFELAGSDLVSELLSKLNPFSKSDPSTDLECAVANLVFKEGIIQIDKSLAIETSKISVVADGEIDLASEKIQLKLVPRAENGIGLGVGTLVKSVSLGGSLAAPEPYVTAGDILKSGVAIGAAVTTGGTSLLADGVLSKTIGGDVCKRALEVSGPQ